MTTLHLKKLMAGSPLRHGLVLMTLALACFALSPRAQALLPPPTPDGAYPGGNTAEGEKALFHVDFRVVGRLGITGDNNTALGAFSLTANTSGSANTATGNDALDNNTSGDENTANGAGALFKNTTGADNTATGWLALLANTTGNNNTANGAFALNANTGSNNVALGFRAGSHLVTGNNNINIGFDVSGGADESNTIRIGNDHITTTFIRGIRGQPIDSGAMVVVGPNGRLGTMVSSKRFKEEIKPMDQASEALLELKPVTFRYKKEIDPAGTLQFGLVAEEVGKVNPDLVVRDEKGKPYSVRYEQVNAMLLNEFLKEHQAFLQQQRKIEAQEATIAQLESTVAKQEATTAQEQRQIEALTAGLQKVSAQVEMSRPAPQPVANNQ